MERRIAAVDGKRNFVVCPMENRALPSLLIANIISVVQFVIFLFLASRYRRGTFKNLFSPTYADMRISFILFRQKILIKRNPYFFGK